MPDAPLVRRGSLSASFLLRRSAWRSWRTTTSPTSPARAAPRRRRDLRPLQDFLELGQIVHLHRGIGVFRGRAPLEAARR
jgi:hypothetical protein